MISRIYRSISEPIRIDLSYQERWEGSDHGLITSWEIGRILSVEDIDLAAKVRRHELPMLGWRGGVENEAEGTEKSGSLYYLAKWQGLRGVDLEIDLNIPMHLICSKTGVKVTFMVESLK